MSNNQTVYKLDGLSCAGCAATFEVNIGNINTVTDAKVNFAAAKVTVTGEATILQLEQAGAFDGIKIIPNEISGYQKQPFYKKRENISAMIALGIFVIGLIMQFNLGIENPAVISIFIIAIIVGGFDLFIAGFKNLLKLTFDMKTLMTIAIIGAAIIGEWVEGAAVVILFAISEVLESYSVDKARQSIQSLISIAPSKALIKLGEETIERKVEDVAVNDIMVIKPGDKIAMDGEVIDGQTSINQASITGESIPVHKTTGDEVFAGTINEEGSIYVKVTKLVADTTIAKIIHLVEEAQAEKAPAQQFVDKFAKYYTPAIMIVALLVATLPPLLVSADWSTWIYLGLATLVVGCPCALIISTPVAIVTAIGNAAKHGVLIKGGVHLEEAGRLKVIAFDKTGTLTEGKPALTVIVALADIAEDEILQISAAIEQYSQHPIASAIINEANRLHLDKYEAEKFQSITGRGAEAVVLGERYFIGNIALFTSITTVPEDVLNRVAILQETGNTVMLLGTENSIVGIVAVADKVRINSKSVIAKLSKIGIDKTVMLTGDTELTANAIASELGITDTQAGLLPADKLTAIKKLQANHGRVAMVGDGINDAPALASATVGIAMGGAGTDAALETADIALMGDDLDKLPYTIALSRQAMNIIKQNISFAFGLKIIALLLVIPGLLTLWLAIIADVGATIVVVLNSMRLMRTKL